MPIQLSSGQYNHPSYLTRQQINLTTTVAGANGTTGGISFVSDMRLRRASITVRTAGTSAGSGNGLIYLCVGTCVTGFSTAGGTTLTTSTGTTTINTITALGSSTAGTVVLTGDMNVRVLAGSVVYIKNGTDATGVASTLVEAHLDPEATWAGP